jgi:sporulation protein YlmC with PRC-barrel domain
MEKQRETSTLIAADKVSGTNVYNRAGENVGTIDDVMIDKRSGKVAYAVMSFGGFLGMGENYHPVPWSQLHYDTNQGGYLVNLSRAQLEGAPTYAPGTDPGWGNRDYETRLHKYYNADPYWLGGRV